MHITVEPLTFRGEYLKVYSAEGTAWTARFGINSSAFCPHSVFMRFVWISEQTAIISLYNIN